MGIQLTLAGRYLAGRKLRSLLTTLAVVLGVTVIFGLNGILPTILRTFQQTIVSTAGQVDISVTNTAGGTFSRDVARDVASVSGVDAVSPLLRRPIVFPSGKYDVSSVAVVGLDPQAALQVRSFPIAEGRWLAASDSDAVVMSRDTAKGLKLHVGQSFVFPAATGSRRLQLVGTLSSPALPGSDEVYVPLTTAEDMFGDRTNINEIEATFAEGADHAAVKRAIERKLGSDYAVGGVSSGSSLYASIRTSEIAFNIFGLFALAMGGFIIFNTFRTAVAERRHDIGMLRSLGASRGTITGMFLAESLLQGVIGTALGLAGGYLLAAAGIATMANIAKAYLPIKASLPVFPASAWVLAIILGMGVTIVGGLWPAITASRVTPLEALRPSLGETFERATKRRAVFGLALVVASLVPLFSKNAGLAMTGAIVLLVGLVLAAPALVKPVSDVFGAAVSLIFIREGRIAQSNLERQPGRSAVTASAVMISLSIVVALLGLITSIFAAFTGYLDRSLGSDFLVLPQSIVLSSGNVGADPRMAASLREISGMERVASLRLAFGKYKDTQVQVAGIDPAEYPKVASLDFSVGSDAAFGKLAQGRNIILNGVAAASTGVKVGQTIRLQTPNGAKEFHVVAIGSDYINAKLNTMYVSQEELARDFNVTTDLVLLADARPGADISRMHAKVDKVVADYPAFKAYESSSFRQQQQNVFNQTLGIMYTLLALLAIPSLLALLNTLAINVIARTREIGMLRAVGSTRRQVRRMVIAESLLLSAMGTALGILSGIFLGYALTTAMNVAGFKTAYMFPYSAILTGAAIGLIFGVIASLVPARHAARLDVVQALRYE